MNRLRFLRNEKGESLEKVANFLNVTMQTISNYETEKRDIPTEAVIKLAEYFGVSTDYLLGKSDIRNPEKININEIDIAFASGIKGLNKENKEIAKNIIEGLLAKQKNEENKKEGK